MRYYQGYISAENKSQAGQILDLLLNKKLIAGGLVLKGQTRFWWKGKIVNSNYYNISVFTLEFYKQAIIDSVRKISPEEVPMIWFINIEGNEELFDWIDESVG